MEACDEILVEYLSGFVTPKRFELFESVIAERTRYMTVLLEDIYQSQNASAVLRTCDCVGIQDVHIVEESNRYEINPDVSLGSNQWLTMYYYNEGGRNIGRAVDELKARGYRIVATSPHVKGTTPENFDLEKGKFALVFGTELSGLSDRALELAEEYIQIPMVGFTESYNISVSAALLLYSLRKRLEGSGIDWKIAREERTPVLLSWLRSSIRMSEQIERKFREERGLDY